MTAICHKDLMVEKQPNDLPIPIHSTGNLVLIGLLSMRELDMVKWVRICGIESTDLKYTWLEPEFFDLKQKQVDPWLIIFFFFFFICRSTCDLNHFLKGKMQNWPFKFFQISFQSSNFTFVHFSPLTFKFIKFLFHQLLLYAVINFSIL